PCKISVAPMMGYTDRHARFLYRLISPNVLLYTEMLTARALLYGDHHHMLKFNQQEHPIVLQLGGSEAGEMAKAATLAVRAGFDEVNINVGCPSGRVQSGAFGACLMKEPDTVALCVRSMKKSTDLPVTVKIRTGVDEYDSYQLLKQFIVTVAEAGCHTFVVHARKAWLKRFSPKQNREIPPLQYERVYRLKKDFPLLEIIINGGIRNINEVKNHLGYVDGVMLGREVIRNPWILVELEQLVSEKSVSCNRQLIVHRYTDYIKCQLEAGQPLHLLLRPLYGLSSGLPGARKWRQGLNRLTQEKTNIKQGLQAMTEIITVPNK
ncbi:MAG TPA: tRNA dihydrouridine(20/20a) synthase DusA, partial [Gammaproteobacteria bacterium]|nr:tRNA dihydrouridine(20/20a) synthase DusA [Gammaproteobacteria bacterium]